MEEIKEQIEYIKKVKEINKENNNLKYCIIQVFGLIRKRVRVRKK